MKDLRIIFGMCISLFQFGLASAQSHPQNTIANIYDYKVNSLDSGQIDLSQYRGKKILIVNVASKCGFTPQYADLEKLYKTYGDKLVIIGFPCDQFAWQEPGDAKKIRQFCTANYGVTFPLAAKVDVKGRHQAPIYQYLTHKSMNGYTNTKPKWNFYKYLVDEQGHLVAMFPSKTTPMSKEIIDAINK